MEAEAPSDPIFRFGLFEADVGNSRLLRRGRPVRIQDQPFRLLVALLARAGEIVTRDELRQELWPSDTYVDFEGSVNVALKRLRRALGDSADNPTFIETVPRRGYRFIAPVERPQGSAAPGQSAIPTLLPVEFTGLETSGPIESQNAAHAGGLSLATAPRPVPSEPVLLPFPVPKPAARRSGVLRLSLAAMAVLAVGTGIYALWPARSPRVLRRTMLTHFGRADSGSGMATDGTRIFFSELRIGAFTIVQVPVAGGDPTPLPLPFPNAEVFDISPDHTELLVGSTTSLGPIETLWVVPVTGGAPRRLGDAMGSSGAWSPDGQTIAYTLGPDLYTVRRDGSAPRRLGSIPGTRLERVRWSPSGRTLRFTTTGGGNTLSPLWEVASDGSNLRPLPAKTQPQGEHSQGYGSWTPDGRYFVFQSVTAGVWSIWAAHEFGGIFRGFYRKPVEIYADPSLFYGPLPSTDGRKIFLIEAHGGGELVRYESNSRQLVPYLGGIWARYVDFSKDGRHVVYTLGGDYQLWLSNSDGTGARRLTFPPMFASGARFSPDGRQIAFGAGGVGVQPGIYLLPAEADNKPEQILAQNGGGLVGWSSDGQSLLVWRANQSGDSLALYAFNLRSRQLTLLPGSEGLHHGSVSPDGLHVAANSVSSSSIVLYDVQSHHKTELAEGAALVDPVWSNDSRTVYFQDILQGSDQPIYRVRIDNKKVERLSSLQPLPADVTSYRLDAVTSDNQLLVLLNRNNSDLYALDVDFP
jgi:DNA-binding winged helix-turn-helix (wHTH) protein/Tol biopolymer transport system component